MVYQRRVAPAAHITIRIVSPTQRTPPQPARYVESITEGNEKTRRRIWILCVKP